ncbi:motility protein A [Arthrobacter agilis]|uniref:motility protein A n=1 Tax=Arthrobacter agilis TaxID=37921 RepID=UPI000B3643DE|nr:MotA/TolQ/ExbB proton channel family protein [Arthrobacter agilis]OUM43745.1 motility protein A [Arthrobacter agilis]PPB46670.1 motility protein A [Arthrobacter agilis]TPV24987.1 motility protein A [Arthrobacter agilis]VDR31163.1 Chemotaxis protein MotA [Arthrobacter agilis]
MDPATIVGILIAFGALYAMITLEHASVEALLLPAPMILVFGATLAIGIAGGTLKDFLVAVKAVPAAMKGKTVPPQDTIDSVVVIAEKARSEGLLALEEEANTVKDPFLRGALQNIADGTDGEELREMLEDEIDSASQTNRTASKFFASLGGYAPTVGIIGTVVSLTHVLENLSSPDKLGPMIAAAFVATLWGLLSANFLWLPIGTRIKRLGEMETARMTLLMEGVLAVQAGSQPRLLGERLKAMVPQHEQGKPGKGGKDGAKGAKGSGETITAQGKAAA